MEAKNYLVRYAACLLVLLCMSLGNVWGTDITYSFDGDTSPSTSGTAPTGSTATLSGDYSNHSGWMQCANNGSAVLTLTGYKGYKITGITITVKSNKSSGTGSFSVVAGSTTIASIAENSFNNAAWNGEWNNSSSGVTKTLTMSNSNYEIKKDENVVLSLNVTSSGKSLYIKSWAITYASAGGGCANQVNITNSSTTSVSHGSFDVDKTGSQDACSALSVTVTPDPDDHYHVSSVSATDPATSGTAGTAVDNGDGTYTITYSANAKGNSAISVTFAEDTKYTVTWSNNGSTFTTTQVYDGDKPTLPANPTNCDATSNTFYGWSTAEWSGALDDVSSKTIYTDASAMPAVTANVTYYAVFAKATKSDNFQLLTTSSNFISGEDYLIESYFSSTDHVLKAANYNSKTYQQTSENSWELPSGGVNFDMSGKSALCIWKITSEGNNQFSIYNASANKYLVLVTESSYDNLILSATKDASFIRTVVKEEGYSDVFKFESSAVSGKHLYCEGDYWDAYTSAEEVYLYKRVTTYSKYRTNCCTEYDITLAGSGIVTGGTIEADPTSACEGAAVTLAATPSTGYTFTEWKVTKDEDDSDVTLDVIADGYEDDDYTEMTMPAYDVTVDATFTAKEYTIVLDKNGGTSDGGATATYNSSSLSSVTHASYTGYTLLGYYTETSGGDMVITANGALVAGVDDYTDEDGKWIYDDEALFAAHWKPTGTWGVTITAPSNGTITVTYNSGASSMTSGSAYIEGSITITATGNTGYELATDGLKVNGTTFTNGNSLTLSDDITISATFTLKKYNIAVTPNSNVAITATPSGESAIGEGANSDVSYGTTMTLAYSDVESGYYWSGWKLTNAGGDDVTTTLLGSGHESDNSATFTVPDYNVKVTAKLYGNLKAWCIPTFTVTGDVHLTSTAGVYVNLTEDADNLINFSGSDLYNVSKITIDYLDENGDVVANSSSPLRLYGAAGSSLAEDNITSSSFTSGAYNQDYSVRLTVPAATYNTVYNYKLRLKLHKLINGVSTYRVIKTIEHPMNGRALPEEFVIAVKNGDYWYALPNNLKSTGGTSVTPMRITVDNTTTPTCATYAPNTVVYKGTRRNEPTKNLGGIRLTKDGKQWLQTAKGATDYEMWLSGSNSDTAQIWYMHTTDFGAYTLQMSSKHNGTKKMGIYSGGYMGFHGSPSSSDIYLLPITTKFTEIAATASEWGEHGVVVRLDTPFELSTATSATMNVGITDPTAATTTAINAAIGTAKRVKVDGGALTVGAIANENKLLFIHWKNSGGTEIGVSQVTIPTVIASNATMSSIAGTKVAWAAKSEVHVLPGDTLEADAGSFSGEGALSVSNLHIYPGATLKVSSGTFNASTLRLHNGWTRAGDKKYDVARVYIADDAALTKTTASMDYDIYEQSDGKHYYPLAVPFATAVNTIDYVDPTLAAASKYRTHYVIKEYDGANRAINGEDSENNWDSVPAASTLVPGKGYIITAVAVKGEAIIRVPLVFDNAWTADGELGTAHYSDADHTKNVIAVTAYGGTAATANKRHAGWNMLGVPYMSCFATKGKTTHDKSEAFITGKMELTGGPADPYGGYDNDVVYVTVPTHDFSEYLQYDITDDDTKLLPGWSFFVQFAKDGSLTFANTGQTNSSSLPIYAPQRTMDSTMTRIKTGVILSTADGETSDKFGLIISDRYTQDYEVGADLEKMFGNGYTLATYSLSQGTRLAFNALSTTEAAQVIPVGYRAPEAGQYTFAINPRYATEGLLRVELIDYQTGDLTDLLTNTYTFTTSRTQDDTRFAIHVTYTDPNSEMPTGEAPPIETGETLTRKFILNGQLYIQRGTVIYDATGKEVRL